MRITETTTNEFPLFDDFREVLRVLAVEKGMPVTLRHPNGTIEFELDEWNWFIKAAEKGWKLL